MDIWHDRAVFHCLTDPDVLADTLGRDLTLQEPGQRGRRRYSHTMRREISAQLTEDSHINE